MPLQAVPTRGRHETSRERKRKPLELRGEMNRCSVLLYVGVEADLGRGYLQLQLCLTLTGGCVRPDFVLFWLARSGESLWLPF